MCFGHVEAPEPIEIEKPVFVRNPFLDDEDDKAQTADALRRGRGSLVIPSRMGIGFEGAGGSVEAGGAGAAGAGGSGGGGSGKYGPAGISSAPKGPAAASTGGTSGGSSTLRRTLHN